MARAVSACTLYVPAGTAGFVDTTTGAVRLDRVLVPVDHRPRPDQALTIAARLAQAMDVPGATVDMLYVADARAAPPALAPPAMPGLRFEARRADGRPAEAIVAHARSVGARLVVMATAGRHGLFEGLFGSTTEQVVRQSGAPVHAVPGDSHA
ncbi:MAG: universal stress protein [Alphaproteobacteria bacterium]|nr:universal stress protein [Alphaproteobacteria bacterium]